MPCTHRTILGTLFNQMKMRPIIIIILLILIKYYIYIYISIMKCAE